MGRLSVADGGASCGKCGECFHAHLFGKFKLAVTSSAMVWPMDSVLLAFSGGPASRNQIEDYLLKDDNDGN